MLKYEKGQHLNPHIDGHTPGTILAGRQFVLEWIGQCSFFCLAFAM